MDKKRIKTGMELEDLGDFKIIAELFEYQVENCTVFGEFVRNAGRTVSPRSYEELTFLPIEAFKWYGIQTGTWREELTFLSSGTTSTNRSRHLIRSRHDYLNRTSDCFNYFFEAPRTYRHLVFMPFYQSNPQSSLLAMMHHFMEMSRENGSGFVSSEKELDEAVLSSSHPTIIWTVTFGLLDYLEKSGIDNMRDLTIIETGGMKGRRKSMGRSQIHDVVNEKWPDVRIISEYGMCELQSQAYYKRGSFHNPPGLFCLASGIDDPFAYCTSSRRAQLNFIDMANAHTCSFIATQDYGSVMDARSFDVQGRLTNADLRGCNLMYEG